MSWISTEENLLKNRRATKGDKGHRSYDCSYTVRMGNLRDGPAAALAAPFIPPYFSTYSFGNEFDEGALCSNKAASLIMPCVYEVACTFETSANDPFKPQNPLDALPQYEWDAGKGGKLLEYEVIEGQAVLNVLGDPTEDPPTVDVPQPILRVTKNLSTFNPALATSYAFAVNESPWFGYAPKTVRVEKIGARTEFCELTTAEGEEQQLVYVTATFEFAFRVVDTWQFQITQVGYRYFDPSTGQIVDLKGNDGHEPREPVFLAEDGTKLPPDSEFTVFRTWDGYPPMDFSVFDFLFL